MKAYLVVTAAVIVLCLTAILAVDAEPSEEANDLVPITGGTFVNTNSNYYGKQVKVLDFLIGKHEVTQKQWAEVIGSNPSKFTGDDLPVETVSWYDSVQYCNRRSAKEGLAAYYNIDKSNRDPNNKPDPKFGELDRVQWIVTINPTASGYRLPTEAEWEYAAGGGQASKSYVYSGANDLGEVGWYWRNSGDKDLSGPWLWPEIQQNHDQTRAVGHKKPNELGLFDMSGNVREWCWDWYGDLPDNATDPQGSSSGSARVWKGGGWMGSAFSAESAFRGSLAANGSGPDQGLRVCRRK